MSELAPIGDGPGEPGLVSVVIPTYNRAYMLRETLDSVLAQSYRPIEVVLIDDGSTDDTAAVAAPYAPTVRCIRQPNGGVCKARNAGLAHARGEFIALLDSDDRFFPWKIEAQVRLLRAHPAIGMVWTDMSAISADGRLLRERYLRTMYTAYERVRIESTLQPLGVVRDVWPDAPAGVATQPMYGGNLFSAMILGNLVHTSTVLMRRERLRAVGGFDESLAPAGEDYEYHLRDCSVGEVALIDAPSIGYRVGHEDQLTAPAFHPNIARSNLRTVERWIERGRGRIALPSHLLRRRLAESLRWLGTEELLHLGDNRQARAHLWRSVRLEPLQPRAAALLLASFLRPGTLRRVRRAYARLRRPGAASLD